MPSNMTEGLKVEKIDQIGFDLFSDVLHKAFEKIPPNKFAIIIIFDIMEIVFSDSEIVQKIGKLENMFLSPVLTIDIALEKINRPQPLFYCNFFSSDKKEIIKWISGQRNQDLVISYNLVKGFENDIIIDTTGSTAMCSRTTAQVIQISSKILLNNICVLLNNVLAQHLWQDIDIMDRNVRPKFSLDYFAWIGE